MIYNVIYTKDRVIDLEIPQDLESFAEILSVNDSSEPLSYRTMSNYLIPVINRPKPEDTILIALSDNTRKTGFDIFFPVLLEFWKQRGIREENIYLLFATGVHRDPTEDEMIQILSPEIYRSFSKRIFINHANNDDEFRYYGTTTQGTPVYISKIVEDFSFFIITGTVKYHYFAGFGGGRKTILPGISSAKTIAKNHSLSIDYKNYCFREGVNIGEIENNIVAKDMQEAADMVKIDGAVNTVLNSRGEIIGLFSGDRRAVFDNAVNKAREVFSVNIDHKADLAIAIGSNYKNLLQTHKVLYNAHRVIKQGGYKMIISPCSEGIGSESYQRWMKMKDVRRIVNNLKTEPDINGQTALSTLLKADRTHIYTELPEHTVSDFNMVKSHNLQATFNNMINELKNSGINHPSVYIMPQAGETIAFDT